MNPYLFFGALLVFLGSVVSALPYVSEAQAADLTRRLAAIEKKHEDDLGRLAARLKAEIDPEAGPHRKRFIFLFAGAVLGTAGALVMSFATP
jgi:hypothetical protein